MTLIAYWTIKVLAWAGIVFSIYSIVQPDRMLSFLIRSFEWRMKWCGLVGTVQPGKNALKFTRVWSIVIAFIFIGVNYIFGHIIFLASVLK